MSAQYELEKNTVEVDDEANQEVNFTQWANEPTIRNLAQDLQDAKPAHALQVSKVNRWLDNLNITGTAKLKKRSGRSSIQPKLIRKQAEWRYASLSEPFLSTEDIFNTAPVTYEDKKAAIQNGLILNSQFNNKIQKIKFIDEYIRAAVDEGTVIVRIGWNYEEEVTPIIVPDFELHPSQDPRVQLKFQQTHQEMQQNPAAFDELEPKAQEIHLASMKAGVVLEQIQIGEHEEEKITVLKNHPTVDVCDHNNLVIDPTCEGDLNKAKFIIYSFETSLAELQQDGKYKNLNNINIGSSSILAEADHESQDDSSFQFSDKPRKKFVVYEYWGFWDIDNSGVVKPIVASWAGNTLIRLEENPYPDQKLPFISVQYLPVRKSIYGEPDGELLEDNQKVVGAVTRGMIDIMGRSANGQVGIRKDALDVTNKRKFDKGMDYEFNAIVEPRNAFYMHTFPEIPRSAEFMLNQQNAEAESMSGVKSFSQGISGQALGATATGIRSALDATAKRELGILRRLAQGIKDIGRKFISMNAEFLDEIEIVRITNEEFVEVRRDDLAGKLDITLSISTAESDNEKAQELAFMLQTTGPSTDPAEVRMIRAEIARLRKMPELAKNIENYKPEPNPLAVAKAQLEVELLKAQVANELAKAKENEVDVGLKTAKTATEEGKARKLHSESDQKDQDFLDKESGGERNHELDKLDHARATDLDLKAADSLLQSDDDATEQKAVQSSNL